MSWSYSGDPANSDRDAVRYLVQDTNRSRQLVTNEEIDYELTARGSVEAAAVVVAETIVARLSLMGVEEHVRAGYEGQLARLRRRLASGVSVYAGGISDSDKDAREDDSDRVQPAFGRMTLTAVGLLPGDDDED